MKLRWLPQARYDLDRQLDYLAERNPAAAIEATETIDAAVRRLRKFPGSGRAGRLPGTRELVVTGTPFIVVYRVKPTGVVLVRVLHAARHWP